MQFRTLACLPVLTGAWKHRGGGLARSTHMLHFAVLDMDRVLMPEVVQAGRSRAEHARHRQRSLQPRPAAAGSIAHRLRRQPDGVDAESEPDSRGLLREDLFTVVHDLFVTDTARYADYVLPATSQIEHLDLSPAWGHLYLALNRPAIAPRGESLSNTELFRRLARALGRTEPYLFESDESMLRAALASGHPWLDGITYERLWEEGYARLNRPEDWRPFAHGGFATRSGKAELYSEPLREAGHDPLPSAGEIPIGRRSAADHRQAAALPQFRLQQHGPPSPPRGRAVHRDPCGRRARRAASRDGRRGARAERSRRSARRLPRVRSRPARASRGCRSAASPTRAAQRRSVNVLTPEEPTDWGGGSGLYDAFVEVVPIPVPSLVPSPTA